MRCFTNSLFWTLLAAQLLFSCGGDVDVASDPMAPDPLETVKGILALHDLLGKQPEERSAAARQRQVDGVALRRFVDDWDRQDSFVGNLYVGFVVGALSRYQTRLRVEVKGKRAEVAAGNVRVVMRLVDDAWRVVLESSVPEEIKARAKIEKLRLLRAGGAG
jgi:hypothetical protein